MLVKIEYITSKTRQRRSKTFIRDREIEAVRYFKWRYGHEILSINGRPIEDTTVVQTDPVMDAMCAGENCGAYMADGSRMV